ncbi:uncharacterized protein LOC127471378 [Manacus candei]|uniref:uncharacterized protein LOC127471378 n=1 Tax=Manacus candei TaxID=415023 RepID=UPI002226717C|nr:uncharacterized protein LOC127471378 [Manacus candei]
MEIMIVAKRSPLWNLLTNVDPFFSLLPVAPSSAAVFLPLPLAPATRTIGIRARAGTGRLVLAAGRTPSRTTLVPTAGPRPKVCCELPALEPRRTSPRRPAQLAAQFPVRSRRTEAKAVGLGGYTPQQPQTSPAAAAWVAPRAVHDRAAAQGLRASAVLCPWERGGTRRRLSENHRVRHTEAAHCKKMCSKCRAPAPRTVAVRDREAHTALCSTEEPTG